VNGKTTGTTNTSTNSNNDNNNSNSTEAAEAKVSSYLQTKVDPVLAPLLQRLILAQPSDVVEFAIKDLQGQKK
jgi:hypothetical protein